eukprot:TRINITY_DN21982_c0_g1_i1.p1 TRINITY_DN21982_c0_g1~~TRINITY_DN21982_c0_g1_i1.p1  ORF type:complete len:199 (+),score=41.98 TRINITY_DN21982_c0_g1_i1:166-762(+)
MCIRDRSSSALQPATSDFQSKLRVLRDAVLHPDEQEIEMPAAEEAQFYRLHASMPHNQTSPARLADALERDEIREAQTERYLRNAIGMHAQRTEKHRKHPGLPRFVNETARRSPLGSVTRRVGHYLSEGGVDLSDWGRNGPWLEHKEDYLREMSTNRVLGALSIHANHQKSRQQEADDKWLEESERRLQQREALPNLE